MLLAPPFRREHPNPMNDPLSEVFSLLDVESARCTRLEAGGSWALGFPAKPGHVPASDPAAAVLRGTLELLDAELRDRQMGASLVARRLADILLVHALRAFATTHRADAVGWIGALADRKIGGALNLMHKEPGRRWTVDELAAEAAS
ncbi:MAG: transcriptional regulator, AraC family [Caulobacteraceae bacterium]|nr:transcriptional regulator, AraC family [Caulobacteraceae bacterium]